MDIDVPHMKSTLDLLALAEVDCFVTGPFCSTESRAGEIGIADQQHIDIQ